MMVRTNDPKKPIAFEESEEMILAIKAKALRGGTEEFHRWLMKYVGRECVSAYHQGKAIGETSNEASKELLDALTGIIEIGKRDMSNPKYDVWFRSAKEAIFNATGVKYK